MTKLRPQICLTAALLLAAFFGILVLPVTASDQTKPDKPAADPSQDASQYVGADTCKNLSRRHLQELRENSTLENYLQPQRTRGAGLRRLPRPGQGACGGWRR